jgi:hypothetical protein
VRTLSHGTVESCIGFLDSGLFLRVSNFEQTCPKEFADSSAANLGGIMAVRKPGKREEYLRYAEHCVELVRIAASRKSRIIQREMAAEWFELADMFSVAEQPAE